MRRVILFIFSKRAVWGVGGGYAARLFILFSFPCSADHERDGHRVKCFFRVGNQQYAECEKQHFQVNNGVLYFLDYVEDIYIIMGPLCSRFNVVTSSSQPM